LATEVAVDDDRQWRAVVAGDEAALTALYREHHAPLLRYLRGRMPHLAEDLAAQTWLDAARNLSRFKGGPDDVRRWLFTIARRRLIDELRRQSRRPSVPLCTAPEPASPERGLERHDDLEQALALVRRLPPDQGEAVLLRVVAGFDVTDVAALMDRSEGSVRVLVHRGLERLRRLVGERRTEAPVTEVRVTRAASAAMEVSDAR
jgi:RNA polymerase sigma-70 factor (ECF subfamily)